MTKKEIVREVSATYGIDQGLAKQIVQFVLDSIVRSLEQEGRIELRNFGVFEVKRRAARVAPGEAELDGPEFSAKIRRP